MREPQKIDRDTEIIFTNFTSKDFEGQWNKKIYVLKAGRQYYLALYLAEHFAKHLVDRELNDMAQAEIKSIRAIDPRIDQREVERREQAILSNPVLRQELMDKCVGTEDKPVDRSDTKYVPMREVPLKTQERSADLVAKDPTLASTLGPTNQPKVATEGADEDNFEGADEEA